MKPAEGWAPFFRMSGAGNDFLALAEPVEIPPRELRRAWCQRGTSAGADGVLVVERVADKGTTPLSIRLHYFNADGGRADLCVNGTRCAAQLAFHLGWAERELLVETDVGPLRARQIDDRSIELEAPLPNPRPRAIDVEQTQNIRSSFQCTVGVPHLVVEVDELKTLNISVLAPPLRSHPDLGAEGANVDFVRFRGQDLEVRTFERGVEGETLACGSGVLAAAAVGLHLGLLEMPIRVATRGAQPISLSGEYLNGNIVHWAITGDARIVARGELAPTARAT